MLRDYNKNNACVNNVLDFAFQAISRRCKFGSDFIGW